MKLLPLFLAFALSAQSQINPTVTVTALTPTSATLSWTATAPTYRIEELQSGSYGQTWMSTAWGYVQTTYPVSMPFHNCRSFRVFAEPNWGVNAATTLVCPLAPQSYTLPDPNIFVSPNYSNTTTIVTMGGRTYRGPSHFFYVSECSKPDSATWHCDVLSEVGVVLTAPDHSMITVNMTIQSSGVLIRSGHNYWRYAQLLLSGDVTIP